MPIDAVTSLAGPLSSILPHGGASRVAPSSAMETMPSLPGLAETPEASTAPTFGQFLESALGDVNRAQLHAGDLSTRFAAGEAIDVHQVMIASQEASVALNLAIQVRNKLVDGYQELMRVNV